MHHLTRPLEDPVLITQRTKLCIFVRAIGDRLCRPYDIQVACNSGRVANCLLDCLLAIANCLLEDCDSNDKQSIARLSIGWDATQSIGSLNWQTQSISIGRLSQLQLVGPKLSQLQLVGPNWSQLTDLVGSN
jgi:hypothetical protein